ncbi:MAG: cellulase family glycosylhydrolase [Thermoanaerobaculales bacterium]|nr:cellulase family glycosylhydrolase [Thermoanaerobaculales bacterium]
MSNRLLFVSCLALVGWCLTAVFGFASPFGINAHLPSERLLDEVADLGVGWIRIDFLWSMVEPEQNIFDWALIDEIVEGAEDRNLRIFATIGDTPAWATSGTAGRGVPTDLRDWWDVCYRAARRYRGRVAVWGMWNEPNLSRFWQGTREEYLDRILLLGADAIHEADPMALVAGPELAHLDGWDGWLLEILIESADELDIVTHHVYPPGLFASTVTRDLEEGGGYSWDPPAVKKVLMQGGWWGRPFWLTETGLGSDAGGEFMQAVFYRTLIEDWFPIDGSKSWMDGLFFYQLADDPNFTEKTFGVLGVPPDFVRKEAFDAYRIYGGRISIDDASFLAFEAPPLLEPAVETTVVIRVRNEGNTTWFWEDGRKLVLTGLRFDWIVEGGQLPEGVDLAPGEIGEIELVLRPPEVAPGLPNRWYQVGFRMMTQDGVAFGLPGRGSLGFGRRELPEFTVNPLSGVVEEGGRTSLRVVLADAVDPRYQWLQNGWPVEDGELFEGAETSRLIIREANYDSLGEYRSQVETSAGTVVSESAWVYFAGDDGNGPREAGGRASFVGKAPGDDYPSSIKTPGQATALW